MAFFKKMVDKFEDVMGNDDKKKEQGHAETRQGYGQDQYPHGGQQVPYGQPQSASAQLQQPGQAPPPSVSTHPPGSALPPGWVSHWDQNSQRYYYLEQATGRTQWDPPQQFGSLNGTVPPLAGPPMGSHGYDSYRQQGAPGGYYNEQYRQHTDSSGVRQEVYQKKEKSGKGGMMAGAAGGLAVGAVGGALVNHAMDSDSDDERKVYAAQQHPTYAQETQYYQETAPPPVAPGSDHGSVSSSDKEDLEEAREDYENASASDKEEAREDYEEQYEETYEDD